MIRVESRPGEPLEKTLKRFKKQCEKEGLSKDINKCAYYEKPSERRRRRSRQEAKHVAKGDVAPKGRMRGGKPVRGGKPGPGGRSSGGGRGGFGGPRSGGGGGRGPSRG
jgi:small subunit ribosomal protein S21